MWKKWGPLGFALTLVAACSTPVASTTEGTQFFSHREDPQNREGDKPVRVSTPTRKLTIEGHKNASYEVWIGTEYSTHNKSCRSHSAASLILGAPAVSQGVTDLKRVPVGVTEFSVDLYLDQYAPGECDWRPNGILYAVFDPKLTAGPQALNFAIKTIAGAATRIKLTQMCSEVAWDRSLSGRRLNCMWVEPFSQAGYSISIDGGTAELSFVREP